MKRMMFLLVIMAALALLYVGNVKAQPQQPQYPLMDMIAQKVIQKYQTSTCQDLIKQKMTPPSPEEAAEKQKAVDILHADPQMRQAFLNKVAAPIANKLFECGMIP